MAQRTHCDICDARVTERADHVWPNLLPKDSRLRSVTVTLAFFKGQNQPIDLCGTCRADLLRGIPGVLPEPVAPKAPEPVDGEHSSPKAGRSPVDGALADRGHP